MTIVPVETPEAVARVCRLADAVWKEHYTPIIGPAQVGYMLETFQSPGAVSRQIAVDGYRYYLMKHGGEDTGYFAVQARGRTLFLGKLYVLHSHRGQGFAREAVAFVLRLAETMECDAVELTVNKNNLGAIGAYRAMGFLTTGAVVADIGNGFVMDDYVMRLAPETA